ncbi:MAG: DEAD/DEAH box helicase [Acidimicrobiaceae bacterium]|nr:DEAD/DEAH box helicase [Acidimicrobiaceae bacterium]
MEIDEQLAACGWVVQDYKHVAVAAALGVAVREVPTQAGPADYVLFVDRQAVGVIEAKKAGSTLTGVEPQTGKYRTAYPDGLPAFTPNGALPFGYESTGTETRFTCGLDPIPASRRVFTFHRPETLAHWVDEHVRLGDYATLRAGLQLLPELEPDAPGLWPAQAEAIRNLEQSLRENRPRALIQMATGAGKTFTAVNVCYRLLRHAGARRILFLVDRANLGRQAVREFEGFTVPDDPRKFTELYNVRRLVSSRLDMANEEATKVHVSTIQRLYSILRGDDDYDENLDEQTGFETAPTQPVEVSYNPRVPIESYDLIIIDECHRSIYGVWRQVLEYFDAFLVGLTATPGIQTVAFFEQNMVMEYGHEQAVADRVNVDFDVFRIRTEITESGGTVPADFVTEFRDRETRQLRFEKVDKDIDYNAAELDRKVVAPDQIRTVAKTLRASLPKIFEDRERDADGLLKHIPKTLIFAKDDSHADDIVQVVRQECGLGNDGAVKITYKSGDAGNKPEQLLQQFRTNYPTRIAVTVDMIATGTDVKPIECVVFMRMVRSRNFFEQMKGRGVEAPRIGGRPGPYGAGPWPERPVSEANKSGNDHPATRLAADQSALARKGDRQQRPEGRDARRQGQGPLHDRGRRRRDRRRPARHGAAGAQQGRQLRPAAEPDRPRLHRGGGRVVGGVAPGPPQPPYHRGGPGRRREGRRYRTGRPGPPDHRRTGP